MDARDDPTLQVIAEDGGGRYHFRHEDVATSAVFADEVWIGNLTAMSARARASLARCRLTPPAGRASRTSATPPPPTLSFRFDETHPAGLRPRQGAVEPRLPPTTMERCRGGSISRRGELLPEPAIECAVLGQDGTRSSGLASRMCQANGVDKIPGRARDPGTACRPRSAHRRSRGTADRGWNNGPTATPAPTVGSCMPPSTGARSITPKSSMRCARLRAQRRYAGEHRPRHRPRAQGSGSSAGERRPRSTTLRRPKLYKLAWDLIGSEFAVRHMLYERFTPAIPSSRVRATARRHGRNSMPSWMARPR